MSPSSDLPSTSDFLDNLDFFPIAFVVAATICPGMTLCIPGLLFVTVLIAVPIVAVALVVGLTVAVVAAPFVLVRGIRGLLERRSAAKSLAAADPLEEHSRVSVAA